MSEIQWSFFAAVCVLRRLAKSGRDPLQSLGWGWRWFRREWEFVHFGLSRPNRLFSIRSTGSSSVICKCTSQWPIRCKCQPNSSGWPFTWASPSQIFFQVRQSPTTGQGSVLWSNQGAAASHQQGEQRTIQIRRSCAVHVHVSLAHAGEVGHRITVTRRVSVAHWATARDTVKDRLRRNVPVT